MAFVLETACACAMGKPVRKIRKISAPAGLPIVGIGLTFTNPRFAALPDEPKAIARVRKEQRTGRGQHRRTCY
ncbi:hypothetical protein [Paraburkholderia dilworthii]|uniref:hypothetical protein n=1 Tax=Paraburkholderia dilworthii TaxID=948106 RepID=UPI0003FED1AA|nr:hypothetical protein [Paraburkholderia dilworthii]